MIGTVRKHQGWLWAIIITVTIISFLYWSPNVKMGDNASGGGDYNLGTINGKKISQTDFVKAQTEVRILGFFSNGKWLDRSELDRTEWTREVYNRLVLFEKMKDLAVRPTDAATVQWIKNLLTRGSTVDVPFDQFENVIKKNFEPQGISLPQFEEFAKHELGREHLQAVYGMTGALLTPGEASDVYHYENDNFQTQVAVFSSSNYLSQVKFTDPAIGQFYTNNTPDYYLPPRVQVNYIRFDITNFFPEADKEITKSTNLTQYLDAQYYRRTNEFQKMGRDDAMKQIKAEVRKDIALSFARKNAAEVIEELYKGHDEKNPLTQDDLSKVAAAKNLQVQVSPLFDGNVKTNEIALPVGALQAAFRLSNNDPEDTARERLYTKSPVIGDDGAYILGLKQRVDRTLQPFAAVKDKVIKDYKEFEAKKLARDAGTAFGNYVTNQIAKGKSFSAVCDEKKVKATKFPLFSLATRSLPELPESIDFRQLKVVVLKLAPGKASDFVATEDGGFVSFLEGRSPADPMKMQAELPKFMEQIREQRQFAAYNDWFQKQWLEMHVVATLLEQKTQPKPKS
ncbi:MAG: peptidylprolyl isomerase [Verrucomicrobiales bacterium]|nr:peptidylprolyl isomerase [Verrucomicrobiales bacterium]